jgi:hypothetical protein
LLRLVDGGAESERNMRRNMKPLKRSELTLRHIWSMSLLIRTPFGQTFDAPSAYGLYRMLERFGPMPI